MRTLTALLRPRSRRGRRGYTLVEITIVAVLSAALITIAARWVGQLGQVALQQVATGVQANVIIATDRIEDDITAAAHCNPWQLDNPVAEITPSSMTLFVDADGDGEVKLVRWSVDTTTGLLTRAEAAVGSDCSQPELPAGVVLLTGVATGTTGSPLFVPTFDGEISDSAADWGVCADRSVDRCRFDGVSVELTVLDAGTPTVTKNQFNLSL